MAVTSTQWKQVFSIALIQGTISLSWLIYRLYLPDFFKLFGFASIVVTIILIVENFLNIIVEPIFGFLSDNINKSKLTRLPIIILGMVLSSLLLIALITLIFFPEFKILLPILALTWAFSMSIFRSPVIALLGDIAVSSQLPQAISILTVVSGLITAFRTTLTPIFLNLGAIFCFSLASFSLLASAFYLRLLFPFSSTNNNQNNHFTFPFNYALRAIILGFNVAINIRLLFPYLNNYSESKMIVTIIFIILALMALPVGKIATFMSEKKALIIGIISYFISILCFLIPIFSLKILGLLITFFAFNFLLNGPIPYILSIFSPSQYGLGVGIYFGGFSLGMAIFDIISLQFNSLNSIVKLIISIISCSLPLWSIISFRSFLRE